MTEALCVTFALICTLGIARVIDRANWIAPLESVGQRIGCIDGVRGYLALAVLCHHFYIWLRVLDGAPWEVPPSHMFANFGQAGVALFFMVTGALFYSKVSSGLHKVNWTALYISRVFRLMPLLILTVTAMIVVIITHSHGPLPLDWRHATAPILRWITFQGSPDILGFEDTRRLVAGVTWSLKYEWHFYILLPVTAALFGYAARHFSNIAILIGALTISLMFFLADAETYVSDLKFLPLFIFGMISVELSRRERISKILRSPSVSIAGLGALAVETSLFPGAYAIPQYFLLASFFAPLVSGNSYFGIFRARASIILSELSYGIYLLHGIALYILMTDVMTVPAIDTNSHKWLYLPVLSAVVVIFAALAHRLVELPGIALGRRIGHWCSTTSLTARGAQAAMQPRRLYEDA